MGLSIRHTANKKVCTNHSFLSLSHIDQTIEKERPFHLQCYYIKKIFQVLKMDRKAILAVVKAIMKILHKNTKNLSALVFLLLLLSSCNAFTKIVTSPLASYGLIIHAELFQATENALTTQQRIVIITVQSDTTVPSTFKPTVKHFSHSP